MSNVVEIGTCKARKGERARGFLRICDDPPIDIPISVINGRFEGKTAFISAGIHGDEINGIEVLNRFAEGIDPSTLKGVLLILYVVNVEGYKQRRREVPFDGKDLNRCFPGDSTGSVSDRMAHTVYQEVVARSDFGIDVHDSGLGSVLLPHPRAHIQQPDGSYDESLLADISVFGSDIIMLTPGMEGVMTFEALRRRDAFAFTVEIGGGMILWETFISDALTGLRNVLSDHGMIDAPIRLPQYQYVLPGRDDLAIKSPIEGIVRLRTGLGEGVNTGDLLAEICDPITGRTESLYAQSCGVIHDLNVHGKVQKDEDVVGILGFQKCPDRGRRPNREQVMVLENSPQETVKIHDSQLFEKALQLRISGHERSPNES